MGNCVKGVACRGPRRILLSKPTLPGNNAAHLRTIKTIILKSTYTLNYNIINSAFAAAKFSNEITDGQNKIIALLLYGKDA